MVALFVTRTSSHGMVRRSAIEGIDAAARYKKSGTSTTDDEERMSCCMF